MVKHIKFLTNKSKMIKKGLWILLYNFPVKEKKPKITKVLIWKKLMMKYHKLLNKL